MDINRKFLRKLSADLFGEQPERGEFEEFFIAPPASSTAIIWTREKPENAGFTEQARMPWQPEFVDHLAPGESPGKDPLHDQGYFYCLDLSSVFEASVVAAADIKAGSILDVCSSPGGKSIFTYRALSPQIMFCNEVIKKRIPALISNLKRCGLRNVRVTGSDSVYFAVRYAGAFDLVLVDAPCSGQSLLVRGQKSPGCLNPATINMNSNRQKRIIANSAAAVSLGGYLAYMTCTFSREENEGVLSWFLKKFEDFEPVTVSSLMSWQSDYADFPCYRAMPGRGMGAGGFTALLKRKGAFDSFKKLPESDYYAWKA